jgi:uncharacterized HAD superfamily protein
MQEMAIMCEALSGKKCTVADWLDYDHFLSLGMTSSQYLNGLVDHKVLESAKPYDDAAFGLTRLQEAEVNIAAVTARGFHPHAYEITREWFKIHRIPLDDLQVVGASESKQRAIMSLPNVIGHLEDYVPHLECLREAGFTGAMVVRDQPWNRHTNKFTRVTSVGEYVQGILTSIA